MKKSPFLLLVLLCSAALFSISSCARDPELPARQETSPAPESSGFGGFDLDWEYPMGVGELHNGLLDVLRNDADFSPGLASSKWALSEKMTNLVEAIQPGTVDESTEATLIANSVDAIESSQALQSVENLGNEWLAEGLISQYDHSQFKALDNIVQSHLQGTAASLSTTLMGFDADLRSDPEMSARARFCLRVGVEVLDYSARFWEDLAVSGPGTPGYSTWYENGGGNANFPIIKTIVDVVAAVKEAGRDDTWCCGFALGVAWVATAAAAASSTV